MHFVTVTGKNTLNGTKIVQLGTIHQNAENFDYCVNTGYNVEEKYPNMGLHLFDYFTLIHYSLYQVNKNNSEFGKCQNLLSSF